MKYFIAGLVISISCFIILITIPSYKILNEARNDYLFIKNSKKPQNLDNISIFCVETNLHLFDVSNKTNNRKITVNFICDSIDVLPLDYFYAINEKYFMTMFIISQIILYIIISEIIINIVFIIMAITYILEKFILMCYHIIRFCFKKKQE
jgi:hypothetical protein